jgi:hypothetical protein
MNRRHAPPVEEPPDVPDAGEMEADGLPGDALPRRSGRGRAPLFDLRTRRLFGMLIAVACGLVLLIGVLLAERAVQQIIYPPTATPEPTPDIAPLGPGYLQEPPSVDVALIRRVLQSYHSPAVDEAQSFYDFGVARGIDPAWCLAFFIMESGAGTQGVATTTFSVGNIRALPGEPEFEGYRRYANWREGIADWYRLIDEVYIRDRGETTIDAIVPVYAPAHDQNDTEAYIRTVKRLVARWRGY